eukprot:scaffold43593_cov31-Tisochrysis_lutea.AAC.1
MLILALVSSTEAQAESADALRCLRDLGSLSLGCMPGSKRAGRGRGQVRARERRSDTERARARETGGGSLLQKRERGERRAREDRAAS